MSRNEPFISVVITCYNYERYVAFAIESALAQTYARREIIVVNDGSTDESRAVIERYADRVRIVDQPNLGSIAAYNAGFAASRGDVVIFLDADDLLHRTALSRVAGAWTPAAAKVQYDLSIIDGEGADLGRRFCNFGDGYDAAHVRAAFQATGTYRWPVTVGNAYSRWFAAEIFPLEVEHGPDGTLNTLAPLYGEVVTIPEPLGAYRLHGANMWSSSGEDDARLPKRIHHRLREVDAMRQKARALGVPVPPGNVLDHELPFINYRLMAYKLGLEYPGKRQDSPSKLLGHAALAVRAEKLPLDAVLAHSAWFLALSLAPRSLAKTLIHVRFNRSELRKNARRRIERALGRTRGSEAV